GAALSRLCAAPRPDHSHPRSAEWPREACRHGAPAPTVCGDLAAVPCAGSMSTEREAAPRRSARLRTCPGADRRRRQSVRSAVELRLGEKRGRLPQNLVRSLQLEVFTLESFQLRALGGRQARTLPGITLRLADPSAERFYSAAQFLGDGSNRCPCDGC